MLSIYFLFSTLKFDCLGTDYCHWTNANGNSYRFISKTWSSSSVCHT